MSRPTRRRERAAAAVEFALILPILVLLIGGVIDYGRFFFYQVVLTNASREGARAAVVHSTNSDITIRTVNASTGISPADRLSPYPAISAPCPSSPGPTDKVTVTASANFYFFFVNILPGVSNPKVVSASATMGCV